MAKVYIVHLISLRLGADPEEFERLVIERLPQLPMFEGWKTRVLKGESGDRPGKYAVLLEVDDLDALYRYDTGDGNQTPDAERFFAEHPEIIDAMQGWAALATPYWEGIGIYTNYEVLAETQ